MPSSSRHPRSRARPPGVLGVGLALRDVAGGALQLDRLRLRELVESAGQLGLAAVAVIGAVAREEPDVPAVGGNTGPDAGLASEEELTEALIEGLP